MANIRSSYNRQQAVAYANQWWNRFNPAYQKFSNDCTSYVSQVMRAGGLAMLRTGQAGQGWWYLAQGGKNDRWSYSWSVAHSLRWFLGKSQSGFTAVTVPEAHQLQLGDIICYDFNGDGKWEHNTVVTAHDAAGQPLVNAHTDNSYQRPWIYRDSPAWTPQIKYLFFHLVG